jgi:hypothetical protein
MSIHHFKPTISHRPTKGCLDLCNKQVSDQSINYQQQFQHAES